MSVAAHARLFRAFPFTSAPARASFPPIMQAAPSMTTRRPRRPPTQTQRPTSTSSRAAVTKSPSVVRPRACTTPTHCSARIPSTILQRVAAVGIDADTAAKLLELVKADAASRASGKVRTADVLKAAAKLDLKVNGAAVKVLAGFAGLQTERGAKKGEGMGGRTKGARDRKPRDLGAHNKRAIIVRLRDEHPTWTEDRIGQETAAELKLDAPLDRRLVNYHLKQHRRDQE